MEKEKCKCNEEPKEEKPNNEKIEPQDSEQKSKETDTDIPEENAQNDESTEE